MFRDGDDALRFELDVRQSLEVTNREVKDAARVGKRIEREVEDVARTVERLETGMQMW